MAQRLRVPSTIQTRAAFESTTFDEEKGTVEIVFTTGARGLRRSWDGPYYEELEVSERACDLGRLNNGAPYLDDHDRWSGCRAVLGVIERAWIKGKEGRALVRFSDREDVKPIKRDVQTGILRHCSVGYTVQKYEQIEKVDEVPVYRATKWTPVEISQTPIAFDDGAVVRGRSQQDFHDVEVVTRSEEMNMDPKNPAGGSAPAAPVVVAPAPVSDTTRTAPAAPPAPVVAAPTPAPAGATDGARAAPSAAADDAVRQAEAAATRRERERSEAILEAVRAMRLPDDLARKLIRDGVSVDEARAEVIRARAKADEGVTIDQHTRVEGGEDLRRSAAREGITNAIMHRLNPGKFKLDEKGRPYANRSLFFIAERAVEVFCSRRPDGLAPMEVAGLALGMQVRAGYNATTDFPLILADVAGKSLRAAYEEAQQTFSAIGRRVTLADFKPVKRTQLGEAPQLKKVLEGAEFTTGTIGEGRELYQLATYGRIFTLSRQAIINDDMDAFSRMPALFGSSARDLESDLVWEQITSNPVMGDGVALFHANHGNLAGAGAAISVATIGAARAAMRQQKGVDKKQFVNVAPKFIVVPTALETVADQFVSQNLLANQAGSINPFAGRLQPVAEPRLDAASATAWYLFGDPARIDIIEYGYLEGQEGPAIESRTGFEVDGLQIKCRHDFGAKIIDWRGAYKNPGA